MEPSSLMEKTLQYSNDIRICSKYCQNYPLPHPREPDHGEWSDPWPVLVGRGLVPASGHFMLGTYDPIHEVWTHPRGMGPACGHCLRQILREAHPRCPPTGCGSLHGAWMASWVVVFLGIPRVLLKDP